MCIRTMEEKMMASKYNTIEEFKNDVSCSPLSFAYLIIYNSQSNKIRIRLNGYRL